MKRCERGSITPFLVVFLVALVAAVGLVVDGGIAANTRQVALDSARQAARAGAAMLSTTELRSKGGYTYDRRLAERAALDYLAAAGHDGTANVTGDVVEVRVRLTRPTVFLAVVGLDEVTGRGVGRARALHGVEREDP